MSYTLSPLPYAFDALEPLIDARTVEIHYTKHHQTYCDKLNAGLVGSDYEWLPLEELVSKVSSLPTALQTIVKNHGWWLLNHTIYRDTMRPGWSAPTQEFTERIGESFWSREQFQDEFTTKAASLFGSWWTWLQAKDTTLSVQNYPNQENPLMAGFLPLVWIDLREHAYYLKHQNKRADYIADRRSLIDRKLVEQRALSNSKE